MSNQGCNWGSIRPCNPKEDSKTRRMMYYYWAGHDKSSLSWEIGESVGRCSAIWELFSDLQAPGPSTGGPGLGRVSHRLNSEVLRPGLQRPPAITKTKSRLVPLMCRTVYHTISESSTLEEIFWNKVIVKDCRSKSHVPGPIRPNITVESYFDIA